MNETVAITVASTKESPSLKGKTMLEGSCSCGDHLAALAKDLPPAWATDWVLRHTKCKGRLTVTITYPPK